MTSARIEEFQRTRDLAALTADLRAARGPLVEPAGEDLLVTFVWIGPQRQVSVRGAQLFEDRNAMSHPMHPVAGTEVWHLSVVAPRGVTTVYQYLLDDPFLDADPGDFALLGRLVADSRDRSYADPFNPRRIFPPRPSGGTRSSNCPAWSPRPGSTARRPRCASTGWSPASSATSAPSRCTRPSARGRTRWWCCSTASRGGPWRACTPRSPS
jgi:hypothetical protein